MKILNPLLLYYNQKTSPIENLVCFYVFFFSNHNNTDTTIMLKNKKKSLFLVFS